MTPRGGKRDGAGRPRIGREVKIAIRESDEARAIAAGIDLAVYTRRALDVLAAVEDGAGIAAVRKIAAVAEREAAREGRA